tara:strand:- start:304 stop:1197 length:894 start_codon:yes stop_codon:yes gene_type:complete
MNDAERFAYQWIGYVTVFLVMIWFGSEFEKNLIAYIFVWLVLNAIPIYGIIESLPSPPTQAELDREKLYEASKIQREKERQDEKKIKEKEKKQLIRNYMKEVNKIINDEFDTIRNAYLKLVSTNAFGKKNYENFRNELIDFIKEKPQLLSIANNLKTKHKYEMGFTIPDELLDEIGDLIDKENQKDNFTPDMSPRDYEIFCASQFKKFGWKAEATVGSGDQGVDVVAKKKGLILVAQCKKFSKPVPNKAVQEVVAGIKFYNADSGVVIAPNGFTKSAEKLAAANNIQLIHHSEIKNL